MTRLWQGLDPTCAVAAAAAVIGDRWSLVIVRELARGVNRFDALVAELHISRKVLTERLMHLESHGVLDRVAYQQHPERYDYVLTNAGKALIPVLIGLQDWGDQWVLGDGEITATTGRRSADHARVHELVGQHIAAPLTLDATVGGPLDVVAADHAATVLFTFPATGAPAPLPDDWSKIPGAAGCTLENRLFRDSYADFTSRGIAVHGVSTQRADEQRTFARLESIPFPLLSDADLRLAGALRLPTMRTASTLRLRRMVIVIDADRVVRDVCYPVTDIAAAVSWSLKSASKTARTT